jgi:RNA polymerase sigma-70 factor (ECF subfamily)
MTNKDYNDCVSKYSDDVYRFVVYSGMDKDSAKDIVQDAFVSLWQKHSEIDVERSKSYLFSTAYNMVGSYFRHEKVVRQYAEGVVEETVTDMDRSYENKDYLYKALNNIPQVQKSALVLKDIEGYSYKEIAEMLELTIQQVEVYIFRARVALKKQLTKMNY